VLSKLRLQLYGFVEFDIVQDSTQSYSELAGNALIARPGTQAEKRGRTMFGVRNSRLGVKIEGPSSAYLKTSGMLEMDLFGNQPGNPPAFGEGPFFGSPTLRVRHAMVKLQTPVVDVLAGQYWQLFGWQSYFHPNTVEIQGLPGQVYSRAPQLRLSHTFKTSPMNIELAVAASRPPQRDAGRPDGQAGLRLLVNDWKGFHSAGSTGGALDAAAVGISGTYRHFRVNEFSNAPTTTRSADGWGLSVDGLVPIIPASSEDHDNAVTLTGSFVTGQGISDLYTGLTGGISFPALPNPNGTTPAPTYTANIDNGLVTYDTSGALHAIEWQSFIVGAQYFLPFGGLWVAANYSRMHSSNIAQYGSPSGVFTDSEWYDANLFWDIDGAARLGAEFAHFSQKYADGVKASNDRVQFSAFYIF
jgi:hypothetical protein